MFSLDSPWNFWYWREYNSRMYTNCR